MKGRGAHHPCCLHELCVLETQHLAAYHPRHGEPENRTDHQVKHLFPVEAPFFLQHLTVIPNQGDQEDDHKDEGDRIQNVHRAHHQVVDAASHEARKGSVENPDHQ